MSRHGARVHRSVAALLIALGSVGVASACDADPSRTLADMAASPEPWSKTVPHGFEIDQHRYSFAATPSTGPVDSSSLPSDVPNQAGVTVGIGSWRTTYRAKAECRVRAPDGRWWLATRNVAGTLSYVPEDLVAEIKPQGSSRRHVPTSSLRPN